MAVCCIEKKAPRLQAVGHWYEVKGFLEMWSTTELAGRSVTWQGKTEAKEGNSVWAKVEKACRQLEVVAEPQLGVQITYGPCSYILRRDT